MVESFLFMIVIIIFYDFTKKKNVQIILPTGPKARNITYPVHDKILSFESGPYG